jgi:hypothetical protein
MTVSVFCDMPVPLPSERVRRAGNEVVDRIAATVRARQPVHGIRIVGVEAPADLRLARGLARDSGFAGAEELCKRWTTEEDEFFRADGTRGRADIIVDTASF